MIRLVRSELLKLRTTHTWWIFALVTVVFTALAFWINALQAHEQINPSYELTPPPEDMPEEMRAEQQRYYEEEMERRAAARTAKGLANIAANVYTSGQFFGLMFVMLLAILLITNEFYHQTATATFLTTPKRTKVITGKLITGALVGLIFWVFTTVLVVAAGMIYFSSEGVSNSLGHWDAQKAILLNLAAYSLWAIFGIGVGVLIRSQIGATITASVLYVVGTYAAILVLMLIYELLIKENWVPRMAVLVPPLASQHMVSGIENMLPPDIGVWPRWTGAVVLVAWAGLSGLIGTLITRKRDIS